MQVIETANHTYKIRLTIGRCEHIKAIYKVDLMEGEAQSVFAEFSTMPRTRLSVLWEMVADKSECPTARNPDHDPDVPEGSPGFVPEYFTRKETFLECLEGETLDESEKAFWEELSFFFRSLNPMMEKYIKVIRQKNEDAAKKIEKAFGKLMASKKIDQLEEKEIAKVLKKAELELTRQLNK